MILIKLSKISSKLIKKVDRDRDHDLMMIMIIIMTMMMIIMMIIIMIIIMLHHCLEYTDGESCIVVPVHATPPSSGRINPNRIYPLTPQNGRLNYLCPSIRQWEGKIIVS